MPYEKLAPFWEPGDRPTFPLSRFSEFGRRAGEIFDATVQVGQEAGLTGFELELDAKWSKEIAALRTRLTCEVLCEDQQTLARRIGTTPETLSRICNGAVSAPYVIEQALYRQLLHFAILQWVADWAIPEVREEFEDVYIANGINFGGYTIEADPEHGMEEQEAPGKPITDNFGRALYALGAVCGQEGWRDFWKAVGRHIYPIPFYECSAQYFTQRLKEQRKRGEATTGEAAADE